MDELRTAIDAIAAELPGGHYHRSSVDSGESRKLPWTAEGLASLLDALSENAHRGTQPSLTVGIDPVKPVVLAVERFADGVAPPDLHERLRRLAALLTYEYTEDVKVKKRVLALLGERDEWTGGGGRAAAGAGGRRDEGREAVRRRATMRSWARARGRADHGRVPGARRAWRGCPGGRRRRAGAAWIAAAAGGPEAARALGDLALTGWRRSRRAARCAQGRQRRAGALGELPDGAAQLGRVRAQLKQPAAVRAADDAIERAAERLGIRREEFEERVVPDFGLGRDSTRTVAVGEHAATLALTAALSCELRFSGPSGKPLKAPPAAVRRDMRRSWPRSSRPRRT